MSDFLVGDVEGDVDEGDLSGFVVESRDCDFIVFVELVRRVSVVCCDIRQICSVFDKDFLRVVASCREV